MGDWSNDRASQETARWTADYNQTAYNRSIGWNGLTWDQSGGGAPSASGGKGITVMSVSITFGAIAAVVGLFAGGAARLLFAGFCFIVVFLAFAVLGYALKFLTLLLTGQLLRFGGSGGGIMPSIVATETTVEQASKAATAEPAPPPAVNAAPSHFSPIRRVPRVFTGVVWGTALGALVGVGLALIAGPDVAAWEGVVRFAPVGAVIGWIAGVLRKRAWRRAHRVA